MAFIPGVKDTVDNNGTTTKLEIDDGLDFLNPSQDGVSILKRLGFNGFTFANHKYEWREVVLASRKESVTLADAVGTALTVADAYQYLPNTLLKIESEVVRVTAIASATSLTITRGYGGTTAAAHSGKYAITLGTAMPEGADASVGMADNGVALYNYDQTFERTVSLTNHEIAALSVEGNPLPEQITRRQIEMYREIAQAMFYGVRIADTTNLVYAMGGLKQFVTTNVTNVAGALTIAAIDAMLLAIVRAGGDPKTITVSPYQAQKLAALDVNYQQIGKKEKTAGSLAPRTWQSMVVGHDLDIIIDQTILDDELHINDWDHIELGHQDHNGISGSMHIVDSTKPGAQRQEKVIRAVLGFKCKLEKGQGYLYGLT